MKFIILLLALLLILNANAQQTEVITNHTIIQLHTAGLGKEVIKAKIQSASCNFDLSTDGLIALKKAAIPEEVIAAMLSKINTQTSTSQHTNTQASISLSSGIYYYDSSDNKHRELDPSILTNQKSGGLGETLKRSVTGLFNAKLRSSLSGKEANTKIKTNRPIFHFVFDTTAGGFGNSNTVWSSVQSPNEFFLVKLTVNKGSREVVVGKENNVKSDIGIEDELKIPFTTRKIQKGVYEVIPTTALQNGEYCFMFAASSMYAGQTHKVYDFGIK